MKNEIRKLEYSITIRTITAVFLFAVLAVIIGGTCWYANRANHHIKNIQSETSAYLQNKRGYYKAVQRLTNYVKVSSSEDAINTFTNAQDKRGKHYEQILALQESLKDKHDRLFADTITVPNVLFTAEENDEIKVYKDKNYKNVLVEVVNNDKTTAMFQFTYSGKCNKFVQYQGFMNSEDEQWNQ